MGKRVGLAKDTYIAVFTMAAIVVHLLLRFAVGATPCPLLMAIPVTVIGSISLSAKRGIIIKDPAVLEQIDTCRTIIFDKTGTLTYGEPELTEQICAASPGGQDRAGVLQLAASLERYSKHPLSRAILAAARTAGLELIEAAEISERPFEGLRGTVAGRSVRITNRKWLAAERAEEAVNLPPVAGGLECVGPGGRSLRRHVPLP